MADGQAKCQGAWPHEAPLSLVKEIPGGSGTGTAEGARLESRAQANRLQRLQLDPGSLPKWAAGELTSFTPRRCREVKSKELQIAEHWTQLRAEARWGDSVLKTGSSESWHVKDMPTEPFSSHPQPLPGSDTVPPARPTLSRRLHHSQKELRGLREKTQRNWVTNNPWVLLPPFSEAEHAEFPGRVL